MATGSRLPAELAEAVFEKTLEVEEVPLDPRVWQLEADQSTRRLADPYACGRKPEPFRRS